MTNAKWAAFMLAAILLGCVIAFGSFSFCAYHAATCLGGVPP